MNINPHPGRRPGLSLLEVMVAMAIFLFSVVALYHLVGQSADLALDVQRQSQAITICQAKMAEVMAGSIPMSSQSEAPLDEDPDWHWSLDAQPGTVTGLWNVNIKVSRPGPKGNIETSLSQLVLDPSLRGNNTQPILTPDMPSASTDNSQNSNSSSPMGNTPTPNVPAGAPPTQAPKPSTPAPAAPAAAPKPSTPAPAAPAATPKPAAPSTPAPAAPATPKPSVPSPPAATPKPPTRGG